MKIGFHTFGCKLNQYETEALASSFGSRGFLIAAPGEQADLYLVNTCTVTSRADHKARAIIRGLARSQPSALVVVTGCSAQLEAEALTSLGDNVIAVPQSRKSLLLELPALLEGSSDSPQHLLRGLLEEATRAADQFAFQARTLSFHTRVYLKIQDGCDSRCAYCRVPLARGPSASLEASEVIRRARELADLGHREIVLTGVHVTSYQHGETAFPGLLASLLSSTSGVRFRLTSLEPESITEELARVLDNPRVCPHFHLPVQSGSDAVLLRMRRRYRSERIREAVALLRAAAADPFIAADIIVGFPGETDDDFRQTLGLVEEMRFAGLHVFPFSPRPGTEAVGMRPRIPERVRDERAHELGELARSLSGGYSRSWIGRELDVLLEKGGGRGRGGAARGVSGNYLKVEIIGIPAEHCRRGSVVRARLLQTEPRCIAEFTGFAG